MSWSTVPHKDLRPSYYQVAHRKSRDTWIAQVCLNDAGDIAYLWVRLLGGGGESDLTKLPWLWGPRIELAEVPSELPDRKAAVEHTRKKRYSMEVGDRVKIIGHPSKAGELGTIEHIDGAYVLIRPDSSRHPDDVLELYPGEFEVLRD